MKRQQWLHSNDVICRALLYFAVKCSQFTYSSSIYFSSTLLANLINISMKLKCYFDENFSHILFSQSCDTRKFRWIKFFSLPTSLGVECFSLRICCLLFPISSAEKTLRKKINFFVSERQFCRAVRNFKIFMTKLFLCLFKSLFRLLFGKFAFILAFKCLQENFAIV